MNEQELKQYLKDNLHIYADFEDGLANKRLVITLSLGRDREKISETKLFI